MADIPRTLPGVERISIVVIDDGSSDATSEVARACGAQDVVRHRRNRGLARAFQSGVDRCLALGADIIVNTDADNQYRGSDIAQLIDPIISGDADVVVGDRRPATIAHFSPLKKALQRWGSRLVSALAGTNVPDATSGFRAFSREAALQLNIISDFTYTLESLIQLGKKQLRIVSVFAETNPPTRPSRLFPNYWHYVVRSGPTIMRIYALYEPLKAFLFLALLPAVAAVGFGTRYLYFLWQGKAAQHTPALIAATALTVVAVQLVVLGILANLIGANRKLQERQLYLARRRAFGDDH